MEVLSADSLHLKGFAKVILCLPIYLFILCSEVLSRLLLREERRGSLKGIQMGRNAPSIIHLLFADDLLLFAKATLSEATILNDCLDKYMALSRQKVNKAKSSVHFSKNFRRQAILTILDHLRLKKLPPKAKHLGLPLLIPRDRGRVVEEIKIKFFQKISGWKAKVLSQAGRTMLIKSVASAILSYLMGFYSLPSSWCKDMDRVSKKIWWGLKENQHRHLSLKA